MHAYQVDVDKRNKPLWTMMGIASITAAVLVGWINAQEIHPAIKNFVPAPSAFVIFLLIYLLFDKWLWKLTPTRWFFSICEPNLSGTWKGKLKSNTHNKEMEVTIQIKQRWSKIGISISFDKSTSSSFSAAILCSKSLPVLVYSYDNTPHERESDTMTRHIGTAELVLKDKNTLSGGYFNSGDRKTEGSIVVTRT